MRSIVKTISIAVTWILLKLIRIYQVTISPFLGQSCRHYPTCSRYMAEAIVEWGVLKGGWMGLKRIGKCHPWGTSGVDPVPENPARAKQSETNT